ncbi:MAG: serine hydrolase [Acidobacteria bacterium]|nr:serine hydrolase [Acidobacteriota bacterium]
MTKAVLSLTLVVSLFVLSCASEPVAEPAGEPTLPGISAEGAAEIDAFLGSAVATGQVPKAVAMVANREGVVYAGAFGKKDVANDIDVQLNSIFNMASMTKPITSVATMMLFEEGAFALDDPVSTYLPDMADRDVVTSIDESAGTFETEPAASDITIRQLLTHASGLAYAFSNPTMQRLIDVSGVDDTLRLPLVSHPGTMWNYSASTAVLGRLVAEVSGMPLDAFLKARIFDPLGMDDTSYSVPAEKTGRVVTIHSLVDGELVEAPTPDAVESAVRGDGGLHSTAPNYIRFLRMLLNKGVFEGRRLLSAASVDAMIANQIGSISVDTQRTTNPARSSDFPIGAGADTFGLGFQITASNAANPDLRAAGSYSWGGIFNTHFWGDPERDIVAVILMQQLPFYSDDAMAVYQGFETEVNRNLAR